MKFAYTTACIPDIRILDIKVAVLLMMDLVAVAATQTSGYCHYTKKLTAQVPDRTAKERGDDMVRLANASALLAPLAQFACPSWPPLEILFALLCATGIGMQVRRWAEMW